MGEAKGVVKHILLAKFKEGTTDEKVEELVKSFSECVNNIESLKAFHWGKHASTFSQYEEFSHAFECNFETMEGLAEYMAHPLHLAFVPGFISHVEKLAVIDYKPTFLA